MKNEAKYASGRVERVAPSLKPPEREALAFLLPLSDDYPGIDQWYLRKVIPGLRNSTRYLLRMERDGDLVGIGIAKNEPDERKICTVRVAPAYANRGIGPRIFDGLLKWLDDDKPHLTVSERKLPLFARIFDYYGFHLSSARLGIYLPTARELGYNEADHAPQMRWRAETYSGDAFRGPIDDIMVSTSGSKVKLATGTPQARGKRRLPE